MKARDLDKMSNRDLAAGLKTYNEAITSNPADYGHTAADATAMGTAITDFETSLDAVDAVRAAEDAALADAKANRQALVALARTQFGVARAKPGISNETLEKANLDAYDTTKTDSPAPGSVPLGMVELAKLRHIISFRDSATPDSEGKPGGVLGCEIWVKLDGDPPADETECTFLALDTASHYTVNYPGADGKKDAHYLLRWVSKGGEKGAWSEVVSATINA